MYYLQFFRTCANPLDPEGFIFERASGYGVYIDGAEYAIARVAGSGREWDITEVSSGLSFDEGSDHQTFPTREAALKWLKGFVKEVDVEARLRKHANVRRALAEYSKPMRVKKREQKSIGEITLTEKQKNFLTKYVQSFGMDACETREVAGKLEMNPSIVGAMISTLVEKGVFETFLEGRTKYMEPTEVGMELMEVHNG